MQTIAVKNHRRFRIAGQPAPELEPLPPPSHAAAVPNQVPLIKPRLLVQIGDRVKAGTAVIEDKQNTDLKLLSPAGGEVVKVKYGPRRVIEAIVVKIADDEAYETFPEIDEAGLAGMSREEIIRALLARGLWPLIRDIPFKALADPEITPAALWVPLDNTDPFHPLSAVYLGPASAKNSFLFGIRILKKLSDRVFVYSHADYSSVDERLQGVLTHRAGGPYPGGDPGVMHYRSKQSAEENRAWYINGQDVLLLAEGLASGRYPTSRVMAVSGGNPENSRHVRTRIGAPVKSLVKAIDHPERYRWAAGGVFTGYPTTPEGFMALHDTALTLIPEVEENELFGFARPGLKKPSFSRAFLSALTRPTLSVDADRHGELRACVNCSYCASICPVDILPQYTYKCLQAEEIEEALAHGLLDCVECGLCSYVCPSKIELTETFKNMKHQYYLGKI